jgi:hyperosmotically inducible protein
MKMLKMATLTSALFFAGFIYADNVPASDTEIVSSIEKNFSDDKTTSNLKVIVGSKKGKVSLAGHVNTDEEASKLVEIAESTSGVKDVDSSKLQVSKSKHPLSDTEITAKVKGTYVRDKLFGDKPISVTGVKVETTNGVVYLTGDVETQVQASNAVKLAKKIKGVKRVDSKIEVKPAS